MLSIFKERPFINSLTRVTPEAYFSHFQNKFRLNIDEVMMFRVLLEFQKAYTSTWLGLGF